MRIAILGVGLIGGSIGLAARERAGAHVTGFDPAPGVLDAALARGAIDSAAPTGRPPPRTPTSSSWPRRSASCRTRCATALAAAPADATVTDVGSTKRAVNAAVDDARFIGGHPLAGAETAGVAHARADLFDGATWYLTPVAAHRGRALRAAAPAAVRRSAPARRRSTPTRTTG